MVLVHVGQSQTFAPNILPSHLRISRFLSSSKTPKSLDQTLLARLKIAPKILFDTGTLAIRTTPFNWRGSKRMRFDGNRTYRYRNPRHRVGQTEPLEIRFGRVKGFSYSSRSISSSSSISSSWSRVRARTPDVLVLFLLLVPSRCEWPATRYPAAPCRDL